MNSHYFYKTLNKRAKPGHYGISGYLNHSGCLKSEYTFKVISTDLPERYRSEFAVLQKGHRVFLFFSHDLLSVHSIHMFNELTVGVTKSSLQF